jgi:regulator of protease activity HflC (stomatin/prohibitin superfamily)
MFKLIRVRVHEVGLLFRNGDFRGLLDAGTHLILDPLGRAEVSVVSMRAPFLVHEKLDVIVKSGALTDRALVLDLQDHQRALIWVDGRVWGALGPGLHVAWTTRREVSAEIADAREVRFTHPQLPVMIRIPGIEYLLETLTVPPHHAGVLFIDGAHAETLGPGTYAAWKHVAAVKLVNVDLREFMLDVVGQDLMTNDKVTLRLNLVVLARVVDALRGVAAVDDVKQALYREAQLVLRAVVGAKPLDAFLTDRESVGRELQEHLQPRAAALGVEVMAAGVRDVILPGEMKDLLNKVTEAKTAAEANLITRREETAAMRSQANTARLLADNPTLMRLRELEVLEKIAATGELKVVLGDKGLADRVLNAL